MPMSSKHFTKYCAPILETCELDFFFPRIIDQHTTSIYDRTGAFLILYMRILDRSIHTYRFHGK
jgi:hypothetical protein